MEIKGIARTPECQQFLTCAQPEVSRRATQKRPLQLRGVKERKRTRWKPVFHSKPFSLSSAAEDLFVLKGGWPGEGKKSARETVALVSSHRPFPPPRARYASA